MKTEQLKIITLMQLSEKIKLKRDLLLTQKLGIIGKIIIAMGICYGLIVLLFTVLFRVLFLNPSINLLIFILFVFQVLSIISCTISLTKRLYNSKDNNILLSFPVKNIYIYISKLLVSYIIELIKSVVIFFPLLMAYATIVGNLFSFNYVISSIIFSVIIPLIPVLFGAILSIPFVYISSLIKKIRIVKIVLSIILFVLLFLLCNKIVSVLPDNIRIVALYNSFLNKFNLFLNQVNRFSLYCNSFGQVLYGKNIIINYLILIGVLFALIIISIATSLPVFFKLVSSVSENSIQKKHSSKNKAHKSTFLTFMKKEFILSIRNFSDFTSNYLFLYIMPLLLLIVTSIYIRIDRNDLGVGMTYGFIGFISLIMLSASNTASATAISSEGCEFSLLKTAPGKTSNIIWSKLLINFLVSFIALFISFIIISIYYNEKIALNKLWLVFAYIVLIEFGLILWSIQLDILHPCFKEFDNSQSREDIKNFSTSIVIGLTISVILSAVLIFIFMLKLNFFYSCLILLTIGMIFVGIRLYFLINFMNAYFQDIEL